MKLEKIVLQLFLLLVILISVSINSYSEYRFKKDGNIIKGRIVRDAAKSITIQKDDKKREVVQRNEIQSIIYTDLNMGKIFVPMTSGQVLEVYKVDEDQKNYIFRKKLFESEEFIVPRKKSCSLQGPIRLI